MIQVSPEKLQTPVSPADIEVEEVLLCLFLN